MGNHIDVIKECKLFRGIKKENLKTVLRELHTKEKTYEKGEFILHAGDDTEVLGITLKGRVLIVREDYFGNRNITAKFGAGELFGEIYACTHKEKLGSDVIADQKTTVLFIHVQNIFLHEDSECDYRSLILGNLLNIIAEKAVILNKKLDHITKRTTKEKILSYLSTEAQEKGTSVFEIPFNRQELADYLSVDRSALSSELCKLRDLGVIKFNKNNFKILSTAVNT